MLGKVIIVGDTHLNSKNYGMHKDYPNEVLRYFEEVTKIVEEEKPTVMVGLGDLTYGKFHSLEYRKEVEELLQRQYNVTNGNRYELKGNHDSATNGMTEYEFYVQKGLLKEPENFSIGNANFTLVNYGRVRNTETNIKCEDGNTNYVLTHDYIKFKDTLLPNFGTAIEIDNFDKWFGADVIICGHIHKKLGFKGQIIKDNRAHEATVIYPGCMARPSYSDDLDTEGNIIIIDINDDGTAQFRVRTIPLMSIEESFIIGNIQEKREKKEEKENRVDISDVVKRLNERDNYVENPEDIILGMEDVDERYKQKALQLLYEA